MNPMELRSPCPGSLCTTGSQQACRRGTSDSSPRLSIAWLSAVHCLAPFLVKNNEVLHCVEALGGCWPGCAGGRRLYLPAFALGWFHHAAN